MANLTTDAANVVVLFDQESTLALNPDLLTNHRLAPAEGEPVAERCFSTSAGSMVSYTSGWTYLIVPNRLQITKVAPSGADLTRLVDLAQRFATLIPLAQYRGLGINLDHSIQMEDPARFILERFVVPGPWRDTEPAASGAQVRFDYPVDGARLTLRVSAGSRASEEANSEEDRCPILQAHTNIHRDLRGEDAAAQVEAAIARFGEEYELVEHLVGRLVE